LVCRLQQASAVLRAIPPKGGTTNEINKPVSGQAS